MTITTAKPAAVIRDGALRATIWKNRGEKGDFHSIRFTRTWNDEQGNWHDTDSFSGTDLLIVGRLAVRAYDAIAELRAADRAEREAAAT